MANKKLFLGIALVLLTIAAVGTAFAVIVPGVSISIKRDNVNEIVTVKNDDTIGHTVRIRVNFTAGATAEETVAIPAKDKKEFKYRIIDRKDNGKGGKTEVPYNNRGHITGVDILEGA